MRFLILSDLHFEFHPDGGRAFVDSLPTRDDCDSVILAGDIADSRTIVPALRMFCDRFDDVIHVPGNHEYYGSSLVDVDAAIRTLQQTDDIERDGEYPGEYKVGDVLSFLPVAGTLLYGNTTLVAGTMWYPNDGSPEHEAHKYGMADLFNVGGLEPEIYERNARFCDRHSKLATARPNVVVTHHLPSMRSVHPKFKGSPLNRFFVSPMDKWIEENQPALWVHGHTHESCDYRIGNTRILCNPYGYHGHEVNKNFKRDLIVEV